jgi:hypothetical protein
VKRKQLTQLDRRSAPPQRLEHIIKKRESLNVLLFFRRLIFAQILIKHITLCQELPEAA